MEDEIARLMDLSDDELLRELGLSAHGSFPQDAFNRGTRILARIKDAARQSICENDQIRKLAQSDNKVAMAGAIADLLATQFGILPAATVAVLLVRSGVASYCAVSWGQGADNAADS